MITPKRMEVYYAKLEKANGSVQYGHRPVLVVSNNVSNHASGVLMVAPLTTKRKKNLKKTEVLEKETLIFILKKV